MPDENHTTRDMFDEPVYLSTPVGDTNIPDPIILPTITVTPLSRLIFAGNRILPSLLSVPGSSMKGVLLSTDGSLASFTERPCLAMLVVDSYRLTQVQCWNMFSSDKRKEKLKF